LRNIFLSPTYWRSAIVGVFRPPDVLGEPAAAAPLRPTIQRALAHAGNERTIEDLYCACLTGAMQSWLAPSADAIVFTEVVCYPRLKALRVTIAAGRMTTIDDMIPHIARWALAQDCTRVEFTGRHGWPRMLRWPAMQTATVAFAPLTPLAGDA